MKYATEKALRKAVEKGIGYKLSDKDWEPYAPDWSPPYDNRDLQDVLRQIPRAKSRKSKPFKAAYVRSGLIPNSTQGFVAKVRQELFGTAEPPFEDLDSMHTWIREEAKTQPPAEGHAPRYGYKAERGTSFEKLQELNKKKPGIYGLEFPLLAFPSKDRRSVSHVMVSDGTRLRRLWLAVQNVAKRLDCQEAQATTYILTGIKPLVEPIKIEPQSTYNADGPNQGKITITIREPLSVEDVMKYYKKARRQLWGYKRDHQLPTDKDCALVEFIQPRLNPDKPEWESLRVKWNHEYPDWSFENWRYLKTTYGRAKEKIFPPISFEL